MCFLKKKKISVENWQLLSFPLSFPLNVEIVASVISADLLGLAVASGAVRVEGVDPPAFRALLRYAYTDSLP